MLKTYDFLKDATQFLNMSIKNVILLATQLDPFFPSTCLGTHYGGIVIKNMSCYLVILISTKYKFFAVQVKPKPIFVVVKIILRTINLYEDGIL